MENNLPIHLQEVVFGSSDSGISRQISKLEKAGKIKKIAPRLYSGNLDAKPEDIIRRNLFFILGRLYPQAVLSHRSALEFKPTTTGQLFLTYKYTRNITLPGVTIRFQKGSGPISGDNPLSGELFASQLERAFLENLQTSRRPGPDSKTLTFSEIEDRLERIIRVNGEVELNKIRDQARIVAEKLGMETEYSKLNKIISALLSTHSSKLLKSPIAAARAIGIPYDPARIDLFETLFRELNQQEFKSRAEQNSTSKSFKNFAFFESYFSNYIEGTVFEVEEAKQIIETQRPLPQRNEDSHDVLGTYQLVSNKKEMGITPGSHEEFLTILQYRHKVLLSARTDKNPGEFKNKNNFAARQPLWM